MFVALCYFAVKGHEFHHKVSIISFIIFIILLIEIYIFIIFCYIHKLQLQTNSFDKLPMQITRKNGQQ